MIKLHLSLVAEHLPRRYPGDLDHSIAVPACGQLDGRAVLRRGQGEGLVPPAAISAEFHCTECVRILQGPWFTLCKRTNDPKLAYIERELAKLGIATRRHGASVHAPILQVPYADRDRAWDWLEAIDEIADDDPRWEADHA